MDAHCNKFIEGKYIDPRFFVLEDSPHLPLFFEEHMTIPKNARGHPIRFNASVWATVYGEEMPYWIVPKPSLAKTSIRMSNSIELVEVGHQGPLYVYVDNLSDRTYDIDPCRTLFQAVSRTCPTLLEKTEIKKWDGDWDDEESEEEEKKKP